MELPKKLFSFYEDVPPPVDLSFSDSTASNASPIDIPMLETHDEKKEDDAIVDSNQSKCSHDRRQSASTLETVAGSHSSGLMSLVACPCCHQTLDGSGTLTLNEPPLVPPRVTAHTARKMGSLLPDEPEEGGDDEDDEELACIDEDTLPGVLAAGVRYEPSKILVEGWLHKKGSGKDWMGSRSWKARWGRLVLAGVEGYDVDLPLLLIYWYPTSVIASTVIVLDSTVVLSVDLEAKDRWNAFRFEIRHASTRENATIPVTRTFAATKKARDAWVYEISQALFSFEKEKARARKAASYFGIRSCIRSILPSRDGPNSPGFTEVWTGDRYVRVETRRPTSPPSSPPPYPVKPRLTIPRSPTRPRSTSPTVPGIPKPPASTGRPPVKQTPSASCL